MSYFSYLYGYNWSSLLIMLPCIILTMIVQAKKEGIRKVRVHILLDGRDETHKLKNVVISGATLYGAPVKAGDPSCRIGAFTENVVVK